MPVSNANFSLSSIDPDTLKQSLIEFLQSQPQYKDYNYGGSNMNALLDLLSRNSFLNSFLVNMGFAEAHLDSAQLRDSVVSRAKELSYIPSSITSSSATINLQVTTSSGNTLELPLGTQFSSLNSNGSYQFTTNQNYLQASSNGTFQFSNLNIYEGTYTKDLFTVDNSIENQIFTLSNPSIDISSLSILVSENQGSENNYFVEASDLYGLSGNSQVYYLQGTSNNQYQFYFGDGVLGYEPLNGASVVASYRVSYGPLADGCSTFTLNYNLGQFNGTVITNSVINTLSNSFNGGFAESTDSIKFNAPKAWQAQDRAVTAPDYKTLVMKKFPEVGDIHVYSGNVTPNGVFFGTVFMALVSPSGNPLTQINKAAIVSFLSNCNIFPIQVTPVDANVLYIEINSIVHVNTSITSQPLNYYESLVANTIANFSNTNLEQFNHPFRLSNLSDAIDNTDPAIISNETRFNVKRLFDININVPTTVLLSFDNYITSVKSSSFIVNGLTSFITSSYPNTNIANGTLAIIQVNSNNNVVSTNTVGNIIYNTGTISIPSLNINQFLNSTTGLSFTASMANDDIYVINNDIFEIDTLGAKILPVSG